MTEKEIFNSEEREFEDDQPVFVEVDESEYMMRIAENEAYFQGLYDKAISGLVACQRARMMIECAKEHQVIRYLKNIKTDEINIKLSPKPKMGFLPWNEKDQNQPS